MSQYFNKWTGWRVDFTHKGLRYTEAWFKTKAQAKQAEARKREELKNPQPIAETPTDMAFLELVNQRLDYVQAYKSEKYYSDYQGICKRLVKEWQGLSCSEITRAMLQKYLLKRARISALTANKELRYIRAMFNFGIKYSAVQLTD